MVCGVVNACYTNELGSREGGSSGNRAEWGTRLGGSTGNDDNNDDNNDDDNNDDNNDDNSVARRYGTLINLVQHLHHLAFFPVHEVQEELLELPHLSLRL